MKLLQVILSFFLLILSVLLLVVESSSLNDTLVTSNITRGSSISTYLNDSSYWLSPSGNIAFGFYQLPWSPDKYVVGIWLVKTPFKTLVWKANRNDRPLYEPSSILLNNDGKLILRTMADNKEKPLIPNLQEPASYAMMRDDGNFVLYGSDSQIIWESFDYPTNTILGGQKLKPGVDLISGYHKLSVQQANGLVAIYEKTMFDDQGEERVFVISDAHKGSLSRPLTLSLDTSGNLYLVGSDGVVLNYLYRNQNQLSRKQGEGSINRKEDDFHIYRATLDSHGVFNLYKERIDGNISDHEKSSRILLRRWPKKPMDEGVRQLLVLGVSFLVSCGILLLMFLILWIYTFCSKEKDSNSDTYGPDYNRVSD